MKIERSNVEFPLWRKKVGFSQFEHRGTTIPAWACTMWKIQNIFGYCTLKRMKDSEVNITFQGRNYSG